MYTCKYVFMYICIYVYLHRCIYVYMYICKCIYVYMYICIYVYMYICIYVYMYICIYICIYIYVYVYMYICIYVYMYICIYVYMYICIYVYMYRCLCVSIRISYIFSSFSISPGKTKNHFKHILAPLQKPIVTNYQYLGELEKFVNYTRLSKNIMDCVVVGTDVQVPRITEEPWPIWKSKMLLSTYFSKFIWSNPDIHLTNVSISMHTIKYPHCIPKNSLVQNQKIWFDSISKTINIYNWPKPLINLIKQSRSKLIFLAWGTPDSGWLRWRTQAGNLNNPWVMSEDSNIFSHQLESLNIDDEYWISLK